MKSILVLLGLMLCLNCGAFADDENLNVAAGDDYMRTSGSASFFGDSLNYGTVWLTDVSASFAGTFGNYGTFITENSNLVFGGDVTVGPDGYFLGIGDGQYTFHAGFFNNSVNPSWDTSSVDLVMQSEGDIIISGPLGTWKSVQITAGGNLVLTDGLTQLGTSGLNGAITCAGLGTLDGSGNVQPLQYDLGELPGTIVITGGGTIVPEPVSGVLFLLGGGALAVFRRKKK